MCKAEAVESSSAPGLNWSGCNDVRQVEVFIVALGILSSRRAPYKSTKKQNPAPAFNASP
jgi:hypothetical protein